MSKTRDDGRLARLQAFIQEAKSIEARADAILAAAKAEQQPANVAALKAKEDSATEDTTKQADKPVFWQD